MYRLLLLCLFLPLTACVTVDGIESEPEVRVTGVAGFNEPSLLPDGSTLKLAIIDADKAGVILEQQEFPIGRLPAPFFFSIPEKQLDKKANYVVWGQVNVAGQPLLQTYQRFEVINNGIYSVPLQLEALR